MPRLSALTIIAILLAMTIGLLEAFTQLLLDTWRPNGWRNTHPGPTAPRSTP